MFCTKCGKPISEGSAFCGECGAPVVKEEELEKEVAAPAAEKETEPEREVAAPAAEKAAEPEKEAAAREEKPKKKGKGGVILGVILGILLVIGLSVGAVFVFAKDKAENFMHATFDKPKDYHEYVVKKNFQTYMDAIPMDYVTRLKEQMDVFNYAGHEKVTVKIGERGKDYLKLASSIGLDLSWLESAGFSLASDVQLKNKLIAADGALFLNDQQLITGNMKVDLAQGVAAFRLPELSEKYVKFDFGDDFDFEEMEKMLDTLQPMMDAYPDMEYYVNKYNTYLGFYLEQIEEVTKEKDSLEVDDVKMDCTTLSLTLKKEDVKALADKILEDLAQDKEIENFFRKMSEMASRGDGEQNSEEIDKAYAEFQKSIEDARKPEELEKIGIDRIKVKTYLDKNGRIVGLTIVVEPSKNEEAAEGETEEKEAIHPFTIEVKCIEKEQKFYFVYACSYEEEKGFSINGSGSVKDNIAEGDFTMDVNGKQYLKVNVQDYDLEQAKKGILVGRFKLKPGKDAELAEKVAELFLGKEGQDSPAGALLSALDPALDLAFSCGEKEMKLEIGVQDGGTDIVRFLFESGSDEHGGITIPEDAIDYEKHPEEYLKGLKFDKVIDALKNSNMPETYYQKLLELEQQLQMYLQFMNNSTQRLGF